jgi:ribosomal protein S27AE
MEEQRVEGVVQALREWRQAHPQATFDEIDAAVQRHFAPVQAQVVAELSQPPQGEGEAQAVPTPHCPQCGQPMQAHGARRRRVPTRQGQVITLRRAYDGCPACGAGLFPPG